MSDILPVNAELNLKADLTKPVEDITDMAKGTHKGIGKIYYALVDPWISNRKAKADLVAAESLRSIRLLEAQTAKDIQDINSGKKEYRYGNLLNIEITGSADYYSRFKKLNAICEAKRLEAAMLDAAVELSTIPESEISDEPLDQTFFNHWRAEAELIDEEDLRKWWAHLLVEETKKPGTISPRTLDVAKNLSRKEAESFAKISQGIVNDSVIVGDKAIPLFGNYGDILALQDAGLIGSQLSSMTCNATFENQNKEKLVLFTFLSSYLLLAFEKNKISLNYYPLTTAGREIYKISKNTLSLDSLQKVAGEISRQNSNAVAVILPIKKVYSKPVLKYEFLWGPLWSNRPSSQPTS